MLAVKLSADQLLENELTTLRLQRHTWWRRLESPSGCGTPCPGAASPHGGTDTLRTAAAAPRLTRSAAMPRPARHTRPGRDAMPCPAAHASHCGGGTSTEQADRSDYDPTRKYLLSDQGLNLGLGDKLEVFNELTVTPTNPEDYVACLL